MAKLRRTTGCGRTVGVTASENEGDSGGRGVNKGLVNEREREEEDCAHDVA